VATPFVNRDPVAAPDAVALDEDTSIEVNVLANDTDEDGDPLSAMVLTQPAHGTATRNASGTITYAPSHDYNGADSFTYKVTDGVGGSAVGTVTVTVRPVNDPPVAEADRFDTNEDTALVVGAPGVLANDTDVDGDALTAQLTQDVAHGTLTLLADGSFTYVPSADFNGTDSFKYVARDATTASSEVVVTIDVAAVNDAPAAVADAYGTNEDEALAVPVPGVLANDHDVDSAVIIAAVGTGPAHGALELAVDGSFLYTPQANFNGNDSFTYRASDESLESGETAVTIFVAPVNDPPVAAADSYTTDEDVQLIVDAPGVLANDSDVDGDALQAHLSDPPSHGDVSLFTDGSFIYTPAPNYNGTDSFTYDLSDSNEVVLGIVVTITIAPVNDPPTADDDSYTAQIGATLNVGAPGVLANDFDDSGSLTAVLVTGASSGALGFNADGSFTYTTTRTTAGTDSFTYKVTDGTVDSAPATVQITITDPNSGGGGSSGGFGFATPTLVVWDFDSLNLHISGAGGLKTKLGRIVAQHGGLWYVPDRGQRGHDSFIVGGKRFEVDVISDIWRD
jgi:VCBS repeat-containing protein